MTSSPRDGAARSPQRRYPMILMAVFAVLFLALGWAPSYRDAWLLENVIVFVTVAVLAFSHRRLPLSNISYTCLFVFLALHEVGAHYTYSEVPYDDWARALFGRDLSGMLGLDRNHFDRLVHFLYGLLITYPMREVFLRVANAAGFWGYLFPLLVVMSTSLLYELIEWGAAVAFGGDLGMAYLGTQGDIWDAHKDSLLATLGALLASVLIAIVQSSIDRDFAREWAESLTVKRPEPLGEVAIERMIEEREHRD